MSRNSNTDTNERRHDLDALRAAAMLIGIVLHASLSLFPFLWIVQDTQQNDSLKYIYSSSHGFRMPLFFLISGFFTMMLWRKRGLKSLLWHRFRRIFLPLLLGTITIIPALNWISAVAIQSGMEKSARSNPEPNQNSVERPFDNPDTTSTQERASKSENPSNDTPQPDIDIWAAISTGDIHAFNWYITHGTDPNMREPAIESSLLIVAAFFNRPEIVELLLQHGADIDGRNRDGSTALHTAAFFGYADSARPLIENGADVNIENNTGKTPYEVLSVDWNTTQYIASIFKIELNREDVEAGRRTIAKLMEDSGMVNEQSGTSLLSSSLFHRPVFGHLWFLWFLCWLVIGFAILAGAAEWFHWKGSSQWLLSPARYLWLIPLTLIPQWFMSMPGFGPDTSVGLLPLPHVLSFYAIFFYVGVLYFNANDTSSQVGKRYWMTVPFALFVIFPLGLAFTEGELASQDWIDPNLHQFITNLLEVTYAWLMTFGCMGLFRKLLINENRTIRYLSDSSYWLYVAHLPLVIALQFLIRDWPIPALAKLIFLCLVTCGSLLITYELFVRYTWLGTLLNGPRKRAAKTTT